MPEVTMLSNPASKYKPFVPFAKDFSERTWPSRRITAPPIWMSTDLRDGNQALIEPMSVERKLRFFEQLIKIGFKEIEVGFPSASQTDFDFVRKLIDENRIPDDVTIIVLTQSREDLIARTVEAAAGAKRAMVHLYNACAPAFRRIVFNMSREEVKNIAVSQRQGDGRVSMPDRLHVSSAPPSPNSRWRYPTPWPKPGAPRRKTRWCSTCRPPSKPPRPTCTPTRSNGCIATWPGATASC